MSSLNQDFTKLGFAKTYLVPALLIFLVPTISLVFFLHAQSKYDADVRSEFISMIKNDQQMTDDEKAESRKIYEEVPFSTMILNEEFAANFPSDLLFPFQCFRWFIRISFWSIVSGIAVFVTAGILLVLSLRSSYTQYLSLSIGWNLLRFYSALQTIVQTGLSIALSYWVTALWTNRFYPKLILIVGLAALAAVIMVIVAIFKRPNLDFAVEGEVVDKDSNHSLWKELKKICEQSKTELPDQVIVGIDDNFFVTEQPVIVKDKEYRGRTLFVSLSLLKQLNGSEADAVLAHEMAHFSGHDTLYSKKISPLLTRYGNYLVALYEGGITLPVFYFMNCFRSLFELSLGKRNREREFRADRLAGEITSPQ
ncbi:MAG: M48 family metallopeptidase, partial [Planctomycetota bacterium]